MTGMPSLAPPGPGMPHVARRIPQDLDLAQYEVDTPLGQRHVTTSDTVELKRHGRALIMALHGGGGEAQRFAQRSGLAEAFGALGHDVLFPQALSHWADGRPPLEESWPADQAFISTMIAEHRAALGPGSGVVPVALIGGSNGGIFTLRMACELDPPLGAAVAVAAALPAAYAMRARRGPPVPLMIVQATEDRFIPWRGGEVPHVPGLSIAGELLSADRTVEFWLERNRCSGPPRVRQAAIGKIPVEIFAWTGPPGGADLWRVVLRGAGHRLLDRSPGTPLEGSLEELIARFVLWHIDRPRLAGTEQ